MKLTLPAASAARAEQLLAKRLPPPAPKPAKAKPGKATATPAAKPAKAKAPVESQTKAKPSKATPAPHVEPIAEPIAPEPELTEEERARRRRQAAELNARYEARQRRIQGIAKVEADARELWPNAFRDPPVPLAVGFAAAFMAQRRWPWSVAKAFLRRWLNRPAYLQAVADGVCRVTLDGEPTELPEPHHREYAADRLAGRPPSPHPSSPVEIPG